MKRSNVCISRPEGKGRSRPRTPGAFMDSRTVSTVLSTLMAFAIFLTSPALIGAADDPAVPSRVDGPHRVTGPIKGPVKTPPAAVAPAPRPAVPSPAAPVVEPAPDTATMPAQEPERRDSHMGTFHEGMVIERDPQTGDAIMQVGPDPMQSNKNVNGSAQQLNLDTEIFIPVKPYGGSYNRPQPRNAN